ncbi:MAG TPA: hypothetical protein VHS09_12485, partial [Polyangiaceae bacterium]|nr:hypothetical protein [Polyangiaceae bacterium]
ATLAAMRASADRPGLPLALAVALAMHASAFVAWPAHAQPRPSGAQPAKDLIQRGRELFEDQQYQESIQTLSGALVRPDNTLEQKIEIDRLLALDHITLGHHEEAENFVRALLAMQPGYELPKTESPRFRDFFAAARARWEAAGRPGLVTDQSPPGRVTLKHASPSEASPGAAVPLTASVDDPAHRAKAAALFYRTGARGPFTETAAQLSAGDGAVRATLPGSAVHAPYVAYYLLVTDAGGLPLAASGDADAPLRIPVTEAAHGWVLPVAIGGGVVGAAGIVLGSLALAGVFKGGGGGARGPQSTVTVGVMTFR